MSIRLWVLGDLVNYRPNPAEVIEFVREKAAIRSGCGNHDHSIGFDEDPRSSTRFRAMAEETGRYTRTFIVRENLERAVARGAPLWAHACSVHNRVNALRFSREIETRKTTVQKSLCRNQGVTVSFRKEGFDRSA
jgi:hypothetical protein